jgi:hypothetical protein
MRLHKIALVAALAVVPSMLLARAVRPPPGPAVTQYYANLGLPTQPNTSVDCNNPRNDAVRKFCCSRGWYAYCQNANINWQTNNCFPLNDGTTQCCPWGQVPTGKHQPDQVCVQRSLISPTNKDTVLAMANLPPWVIATVIKQHLDILWCYEAGIAWCTNPGNGIPITQRKQCIESFFISCLEEEGIWPAIAN